MFVSRVAVSLRIPGLKKKSGNLGLSFAGVNCLVVFPNHLNPNNFLFYITSNFTPIHVYPRLKQFIFVIARIIKVEVSVTSRSRRLKLITLTETLIIPDITKTEFNNCFIIIRTNALC